MKNKPRVNLRDVLRSGKQIDNQFNDYYPRNTELFSDWVVIAGICFLVFFVIVAVGFLTK